MSDMSISKSVILAGVAVLAAGILGSPAPAAGAAPAVVHHDLAVTLDPANGSLAATDRMTVRPEGAPLLALALSPRARIDRVAVAGKDLAPDAAVFRDGRLDIPILEEARGGTLEVTVAYRAVFRDPVPENPVGSEDPSYGVVGTITEKGTFLSGGADWHPAVAGDEGQATFRLRVEAPEGIEAVTTGRLVERGTAGGRTFSVWDASIPLSSLSLAAGRYLVQESTAGGVKIYTYFYAESDSFARKYHKAVANFIEFYKDILGPYPFPKFAVAENFFPTGYGFPSWTLLGSTVVRLPFIIETSLGHEIAHSWWGNGVLVDYNRGNWSEGLTTYVADYLYKEKISPEEGREYRVKILRDYATLVSPERDIPLKSFTARSDPATRAVGYGKSAMVFHMARRAVGDEAFWKSLREVIRDKFGKTADWSEFDRAFSRNGATDLSAFFRQWVDREGAPDLGLRDVKAKQEAGRWTITGRIVQERPYFDIQVPLRLIAEGGPVDAAVHIVGEDVRFSLASKTRPQRLIIDPEADLFRRLDPAEIPPTVNGIKGSSTLIVVAARGIDPEIFEAGKLLLTGLGHRDMTILREESLSPSFIAGHDVLYIGLPETPGFLPPLPREVQATRSSFKLRGKSYPDAKDALFVALPHPNGGGRITALFLPLSPEAGHEAARKITHYGKYSYLAFTSGNNRDKGTWAVSAGPSLFIFPEASRNRR